MNPLDGPFKRQPREHQLEALRRSADADAYGLLFEQRCGKSQPVLDTAAYAYRIGRINTLLIVAPNGVHRNWVTDEIPAALAEDVNPRAIIWRSGRMESKTMKAELRALFEHEGLAILSVNIDAILNDFCSRVMMTFLKKRRVMTVVDESLDISAPGAKRTKRAMVLGRHSVMRRILDGTPVDATPLGLYSQFNFLQHGALGFRTYTEFKAHYAEIVIKQRWDRTREDYVDYPDVIGFKNLDELKQRIDAMSYRVTRDQCADLPPKVYEKIYFQLPKEVRRAYDELRTQFRTELQGGAVSAPLVLTRYLRLQQLTSNIAVIEMEPKRCPVCAKNSSSSNAEDDVFDADPDCPVCDGYGVVPGSDEQHPLVSDDRDARLNALGDALDRLRGQGIVWAKFRTDHAAIARMCVLRGINAVFYHGGIDADERFTALRRFQAGDAQLFVGNPRAGGRGLDLSGANFVIYYSQDWPLRWRRQSEDRAQSLVKRDAVLYLDLIAEDTIDEKIVAALRAGRNISDMITGDTAGDWI